MDFIHDYENWFKSNFEKLKKMTPIQAKRMIVYQLLIRGLASPEAKHIDLAIGPDGKITDASLNLSGNAVGHSLMPARQYFKAVEKQKQEENESSVTPPEKIDEILEELKQVASENDPSLLNYQNSLRIELSDEYHKQIEARQEKNEDCTEYIYNFVGNAIEEAKDKIALKEQKDILREINDKRSILAGREFENVAREQVNTINQVNDKKLAIEQEKKAIAKKTQEQQSAKKQTLEQEFSVDGVVDYFLQNGNITPEHEAYLKTQGINGLEDLKTMIPPNMLPPELSMDNSSDYEEL